MSSPFSAVDLLHDVDLEIALGNELLQLGVLDLFFIGSLSELREPFYFWLVLRTWAGQPYRLYHRGNVVISRGDEHRHEPFKPHEAYIFVTPVYSSTDKQSAVASYVDQAAALLGIPLGSERRAGVVAAFAAFSDAATLLMSFPLPAETEQASVYSLADASGDR